MNNSLQHRITTVLSYGADARCEVVSPQRALVFACELVVAHHDNIEGKKLLAIID